MKKTIQSIVAASLIFQSTWAQVANADEDRPIRGAIITPLNEEPIRGYVQALSDSSLAFSTEESDLSEGNKTGDSYKVFMFYDIFEIRIHGKGTVVTGILVGGVTGFTVGALVGIGSRASEDLNSNWNLNSTQYSPVTHPQTNSESNSDVSTGGLIGFSVGSVIGAAIGSGAKKKYLISGNRDFFRAMEKDARLIQ
ncbi:MAG: hypothetical protein ACHQET_04290 [Chitinophagales bacterium]